MTELRRSPQRQEKTPESRILGTFSKEPHPNCKLPYFTKIVSEQDNHDDLTEDTYLTIPSLGFSYPFAEITSN